MGRSTRRCRRHFTILRRSRRPERFYRPFVRMFGRPTKDSRMSCDSTLPSSSDKVAILRHFMAQPMALAPMLDQLTGLATRLLGVPIVYIVLGDAQRQT